jgi:hypothetical protein
MGCLRLWRLVNLQQEIGILHHGEKTYYELTTEEKFTILKTVLPVHVQIYKGVSEEDEVEICLYDTVYKEFITENGYNEQNLFIFWNNCVVPLLNDYLNRTLPSVS